MKTIVFGDIHGEAFWKDVMKKEKPERVIFLGDYLDSFTVDRREQVDNLIEILKVPNAIRCLGNHDYHYLTDNENERYSGFNYLIKQLSQQILKEAYKQKKIVPLFIENNIIFSHAGVSKFWLKNVSNIHLVEDINNETIDLKTYEFNVVKDYNIYGDTISQSPMWIRPKSLIRNKLSGYIQIVGHTPMDNIMIKDNVYFCDCLDRGEYLEIKDNNIIVRRY